MCACAAQESLDTLVLTDNLGLLQINRDFKEMNSVWNTWLDPENKPARATVEAAMARPEILVEIQVTAVLPSK